jgi:cephalosporin-C deacetylase-like acetyl esterase
VHLLSTNELAFVDSPCVRLDNFGSSVLTNMPFDVAATGVAVAVSGTLRDPGFLRLSLPPTKNGGKDPYVFSVGFEPEKIVKGSPSPADFDSFWAAARARLAREVPLDAQVVRVPERSTPDFDFHRISFATFGRRVHGYMSVPTDKSRAPFPVDFGVNAAGFGSWTNDMSGEKDSIRVQFSVYPFEPDWKWKESGLEAKYKAMDAEVKAKYGAPRYCQAGITESREAYFFYPVILGIDRAVDWIAARPDVDRSRFRYQGTSQGGGFGFFLCGLNRAFTCAAFYVPAITDTMGYLAGRQSGWPQIVENNSSTPERRAAAERWAPYFDGANFASRIACPVRVAVGFSDTTCPPCAVYAAYNEIKVKDKAIGNGIGMTHSCSGHFYNRFGKWVKGNRP